MDHATMLHYRDDVLRQVLAPERAVRDFLSVTHPTKPEALEAAERVGAALGRFSGRLMNIVDALDFRFKKPLTFVPGAMPCRYGLGSTNWSEDPWMQAALFVEDTRVSLVGASAYIRPIPLELDGYHGPPLFLTLGEELFRAANAFLDRLRDEGAKSREAGAYCDLIAVIFIAECEALFGVHRLLSTHFGELFLMFDAEDYEAAAMGESRIPAVLFDHEYESVKAQAAHGCTKTEAPNP